MTTCTLLHCVMMAVIIIKAYTGYIENGGKSMHTLHLEAKSILLRAGLKMREAAGICKHWGEPDHKVTHLYTHRKKLIKWQMDSELLLNGQPPWYKLALLRNYGPALTNSWSRARHSQEHQLRQPAMVWVPEASAGD